MGTSTHWQYETRLPAEPRSASRARAFVCRHLVEHRLLQILDPVRLVVSELATNAIVHTDTPFTVTLSLSEDAVLLSVQNGSSAPRARSLTLVVGARGEAAAILDILTEQWGVTTDPLRGETMWAKFPRPREVP